MTLGLFQSGYLRNRDELENLQIVSYPVIKGLAKVFTKGVFGENAEPIFRIYQFVFITFANEY